MKIEAGNMNQEESRKSSNGTAIEINHLKKSFGQQEVLKDISLKLKTGENLVVLGKSGTGKSVLIKLIVGLLSSDSGEINVFGKNVLEIDKKSLAEIRKKIGFLFQSGALYDSMTVKQNLEFPLRRIKKELNQTEIDAKVLEVLENVGLADALDKMPSQLSGGMRKRISLARTIIVDPEIMLYDEPTTGLDPVTSDEISILINECALNTADRIVMLNDGTIYKEGSPEEFTSSDDKLIKSFFN